MMVFEMHVDTSPLISVSKQTKRNTMHLLILRRSPLLGEIRLGYFYVIAILSEVDIEAEVEMRLS